MAEAKALLPRFVEKTSGEEDNLLYEFTINGDTIFCREAYLDAAATEAHLTNVGELIEEMLKLSTLERFEVHGPIAELDKLRPALDGLNPAWFALECGRKL